jgi:hypothetical protein
MNIYQGDQVKFYDGSYTVTLKKGANKLTQEYEGLRTEICTVVAINVPCPIGSSNVDCLIHHNNCIVSAPNGDIIFCSQINIKKI